MKIKKLASNRGFTIVELMIALSVLSTILVMGTVILIQIGALYTKGVNGANLQNTARNVLSDLSSSLRFSADDAAPCTEIPLTCYAGTQNFSGTTVYSYCIGTIRYSYVLNRKLGQDSSSPTPNTPHVLWRDNMNTLASCPPLDLSLPTDTLTDAANPTGNGGYEMVPLNMRLTKLKVTKDPADSSVFTIDTWLAYGDNDLLITDLATGQSNCRGGKGTQYCGTAPLTTIVKRRLD
jgi:prepilin-type N-terminal cleavage/methylation domain-containing protein